MRTTDKKGRAQDFSIVGIGASAGGLEALSEFFRELPVDTGMGFVVVTHLDPRHKSILAELLGKETGMPVHQVEDGMRVERDNVYVIPPNAAMRIEGGLLRLSQREPTAARLPIDSFLRSLAESQHDRAVGIILSGTGSDGSLGLGDIKEQGGTTLVQEPRSAEFDAMPRNAIATGSADFVFPPLELGKAIERMGRNLSPGAPKETVDGVLAPDDEMQFEQILAMLNHVVGVDFREYRPNSIRRRLRRRLVIQEIPSLSEYVRHLEGNPDELRVLAQDFLIRVTRFLRDPEVFHALRHSVFPHLLRERSGETPVRVWVAGCASGEEVYSIAMCFAEAAETLGSRTPVQIFGSDVNPAAIEVARSAVYPENIALDVSPQYLERFFTHAGGHYQVRKSLRELCVFSVHDLTKDPPFGRMDVVSCRNVLIYFDTPLQRKVIPRLHFALKPEGYLVMGKSESTGTFSHLFSVFDKKSNIFSRKTPFQLPLSSAGRLTYGAENELSYRTGSATNLQRHVEQTIARQWGPPALVVNDEMAIMYAHGNVERYVRPASDNLNAEALEIGPEELRTAIGLAIEKIKRTGEAVRTEDCKFADDPKGEILDISVIPLSTKEGSFLVLLERSRTGVRGSPEAGGNLESSAAADLEKLRYQSRTATTHLRALQSEHQAALEEQSAANEELQSLNEELESAKEDVESSNAELTAVNKELQTRNTDLSIARELAQATTDAIRESLVILNSELRVVGANSTFFRIFQIPNEKALGASFFELGNGQWNKVPLLELLREVVASNAPFDSYELEVDVPALGRRAMMLNGRRVDLNRTILLAIEDVTEGRILGERLRQSQKLEAIGQLAGGVAHDFNNILTGILGNASLLLDALPPKSPLRPLADQVISGSERAAKLTRQLLAYAGKGRFFLERVDISKLVVATAQLIHASIPRRVHVRMDLDQNPPVILADSSQIQQIVMNLIINAAEAIGDAKGTVTIVTGGMWIESHESVESFTEERALPGRYVFLEVHDDGCGMDEETRRKIFSPFFTTKFTGRGLGLASILGIVRSHHGVVQVHSSAGKGSTFKVLMPESPGLKPAEPAEIAHKDHRGTGTVLIVDDEPSILDYAKTIFEHSGYTTLMAENGELALEVLNRNGKEISFVLLDVTMPVMGGVEVLARIREIYPELPVVVTSGFSEEQTLIHFKGLHVDAYLQKPYTPDRLMAKIEAVRPKQLNGEGGQNEK